MIHSSGPILSHGPTASWALDEFMVIIIVFHFEFWCQDSCWWNKGIKVFVVSKRIDMILKRKLTFCLFQCQYSKLQLWFHNSNSIWICNNDGSLPNIYVLKGCNWSWNFTLMSLQIISLTFTYNCTFGQFLCAIFVVFWKKDLY